MNHRDHVNLVRDGVPGPGGTWADLGSGAGAFTLALAELIGPLGQIYSIDQDRRAMEVQAEALRDQFPAVKVHYRIADFRQPLDLPLLDGIVMANSLHFVATKEPVLKLVKSYLRPGGRLIVVEYNIDSGNAWVPYPFSYPVWTALAQRAGFEHTRLLATRPSHFLGEIYSAVSW